MEDAPNLIKFASVHPYVTLPQPAQRYIPEWYKKSDRFTGGDNKPVINANGSSNRGIKTCMGFLDGLTSGYIAELWQDVYVKQAPLEIHWKTDPQVMTELSPSIASIMPVPQGHHPNNFAWLDPYVIQTPPGYSCMITHPLNRFDLPFTTLSGIVDSDGILPSHANMPFFLKTDFEGIIPAGTPIFQITPFKRSDWVSERSEELAEESKRSEWLTNSVVHGWYKKNLWQLKKYQ
jgi:hypothetical protein